MRQKKKPWSILRKFPISLWGGRCGVPQEKQKKVPRDGPKGRRQSPPTDFSNGIALT